MKKIRIGITGGAGYTGGELIRILLHHPFAELIFVQSKSHTGQFLSDVHHDLAGETDFEFSESISPDIDILFLCVGHGEAKKYLMENQVNQDIRIIDLSQDFRLLSNNRLTPAGKPFVYGLPELNRDEIKSAHNIANPGCFATAIELGLLPLAQQGWLTEVYCTGITGSTGAGQGLNATSHFSWRANNIQAYKTLTHQHLAEVNQTLNQIQKGFENNLLHFVPWRGDFTRGIFVSSQLKIKKDLIELTNLYKNYYKDHPFTVLSENPIFLKQVVNTNKCIIQLEKQGDLLVVHSAIDNLLKGASGQAVQNMNLMFGLDEAAGLKFKANYF
ncbi:MAG TPA: N-acetyl-gamma-glutamyl-phosphate reductase [Puia sp.]|jgi:N-acetyl-gamma-glutamyl-phosphate reductase|nr:N-acetyl-gamma-glutamyl-phosphate reductase [Puia sp.]